MIRNTLSGLACALAITGSAIAAQVTINPSRDNTLYETGAGELSNGAGLYCFTGVASGGDARRAVFLFDVAGSVPPGSTIQGAVLTFHMSRTTSGVETQTLYRMLVDWGEAGSAASGQEGGGAASQAGDATWIHAFYNTTPWANPGGDYLATDTDFMVVNGDGFYQMGGPQLIADVQDMYDNPATNFGWLLKGDEQTAGSTKRYDTKDHPTPANRPALDVFFLPPPCTGDLNNDGVIDTADLGILIGEFGTAGVLADINGDMTVDTADLGILIGVFGTSCP